MESLHQIVQQAVTAQRVGVPVFVRWLVSTSTTDPRTMLDHMLSTCASWLNAPVHRLHAKGHTEKGQITLSVLYERGQTALLTAHRLPQEAPTRVDLMLLGNKGAIYHEDDWPVATALGNVPMDSPPKLRRAINESLSTGQAVIVGEG